VRATRRNQNETANQCLRKSAQRTEGHVPDDIYEQARKQFAEEELIDLTLAILTI
jgi:hypothetical protein